jgi:hypothetical protein
MTFGRLLRTAKALTCWAATLVSAVYTNGASPAQRMLAWFREYGGYAYTLIHDPDKAGREWCETVSGAIRHATTNVRIVSTSGTLDPDETILSGWWPDIL